MTASARAIQTGAGREGKIAMPADWSALFNAERFMPHGHCFLWLPGVLWLHVISDAVIAIAYFSIPFALARFIRLRTDLAFKPVFAMFGVFILACGLTHLFDIATIWYPLYWEQGLVKALTAIASIGTAFLLWPLIPQALALPSPSALEHSNQLMRQEIEARERTQQELTKTLQNLAGSNAEMEYNAMHDSLTGLANRTLLKQRLTQSIENARRKRCMVAVAFLDIDHFKVVNDSLGHSMGDALLKTVGDRLAWAVRETDTVARLGGDEFVVVLTDQAELQNILLVAQKLANAISQDVAIKSHQVTVSASIGVSVFPQDGEDGETLMKHADAAMYRAKAQGRNNIQFYTREMHDKAVVRMELESSLRRALERGEFFLHYQPQADLKTGKIVGVEALVRWRHPELGVVSPADFIPLAEEIGLIIPLGEWVLRTACAQSKVWHLAGLPRLTMSVNFSMRQFSSNDLPLVLAAVLRDTALPPELLRLELTESSMSFDVERAIVTMTELKALGVELSIDDFGTGYSSLSYLKRFPIDELKIDQSFVRDISFDTDDAAIVASIIALARNLKLRVVAEGVETGDQLDYLKLRGCDEMQGYLFARPMPADEVEQMVRQERRLPATAA
jgi:diguanylate cyclase (GGDEF)-like protein